MSQGNVEAVRQPIRKGHRGLSRCCTENVKLETPMAAVGGVYRNRRHRVFFGDIQEAAPDFRIELDGVQEVDSKRLLAFMRASSNSARKRSRTDSVKVVVI